MDDFMLLGDLDNDSTPTTQPPRHSHRSHNKQNDANHHR